MTGVDMELLFDSCGPESIIRYFVEKGEYTIEDIMMILKKIKDQKETK